ncbi:MAG TPA: hypothetical protein VLC09_18995 [Polyangiaceae bacterium]|nr:hypothetical protein [Polyangiaceae bacterium]
MRLSAQLLERIQGKTGKITCKVCDARLRLDHRGEDIIVSTDGVVGRGSAAAMLSRPSSAPLAPVEEVVQSAAEEEADDSGVPSLRELAVQSLRPQPSQDALSSQEALPLTSRREALPLVSRRESLPLVRRSSSYPPPASIATVHSSSPARPSMHSSPPPSSSLPARAAMGSEPDENRTTAGSLSPHVLDDAITHLGNSDDSSPYSASLRDEEIDRLYAHTMPNRRSPSRAASIGAHSPARSTGPQANGAAKSSLPPAPPRPWELAEHPVPSHAPGPFDRFGLVTPEAVDGPVRLSADGRLINASDRPMPPRRSRWSRGAVLTLATLLGLGAGAALARSQSRARLGAETASQPREIELERERPESAAAAPIPAAAIPAAAPAVESPSVAVVESDEVAITASGPAQARRKKSDTASTDSASTDSAATDSAATESSEPAQPAAEPAKRTVAAPVEVTPEEPPPFDPGRANVALNEAIAHASTCRREGDPSGVARVVVTFAPSGRVTSATISGPPFAGTDTGSCIAGRFRAAAVPAFTGEYATVSKTVTID